MISHPFPYRIIRSSRKTLAIQISVSGQVTVRAPHTMPDSTIHRFLSQKESWILEHLSHAATDPAQSQAENPPLSEFRRSYYMESARKIFKRKTAVYARKMGVTYGRITIREQKTRWGSCTSEGNLNFNWRLIFAPEKVLDYVVVHELSHRKEMNHSPAFYAVVASVMPFFKKKMGVTFWEYQNEYRLSFIYKDLINTKAPVHVILERHGFTNYKLFRRMFQEHFGCTPTKVRENMRK